MLFQTFTLPSPHTIPFQAPCPHSPPAFVPPFSHAPSTSPLPGGMYGMSVGLKNPGPLAPSHMANLFDWAIIESCIYFSDSSNNAWYSGKYQCDYSNEFIVRNKAVFSIEYKELWGTSAGQVNGITFPQAMCAISNAHGFNTNLCSFSLGTGPRYPFANCPLHKPAGCDNVWKECVKQSVYAQYKKQGMARWDAVGQCMRAKRAACRYKA
ncbi:unnamed protein product [Closterium sp. Naga37s-1]|nr:unnamed protein product [Closterium sp. Naga37s-1]